jgi:gliding motility-associated-like protein
MKHNHTLEASATSGLPVIFEVSDRKIASVSENTLYLNKDGIVNIKAMQKGDNNWNPAPEVIKSITILPSYDNITSMFSPNSDGTNDYWVLPKIEELGTVQVIIYNRFSKLVYESADYKNDWDGTYNGTPLPSASYYYIIKSSEEGFIKGVVNLVR